jgi:hypothetical protein
MKKVIKNVSIILASVIVAMLVATLVLSLIVEKPLLQFATDAKEINVYSEYRQLMVSSVGQEKSDEAIKSGFDSIRYSKLEAMFSSDHKIMGSTEKDLDGNEVAKKIKASDFYEFTPSSTQFMIIFDYAIIDENGNIKYLENENFKDSQGKKIKYNRLAMLVNAPDGDKKVEVVLYPFLEQNINNQSIQDKASENGFIGSAYYVVYEFKAKFVTKELHENLAKIYNDDNKDNTTIITS